MKYHTAQTRNKADGTECAANDGKSGKCSSGTCVAAAACTNDCQTSGIKQCYGTTSYQACGNYDADSCLEWSSSASCPSGQACLIDGICISGPYCNCLFTNQQCDFGETCNCNWGFASCDAPECFCSAHHSGYCSVGEACDDSPGGHGCFTPNQVGCGAEMVFMQKLNKKRLYS